MNNLQIFRSADFGSIRTIEQDGKVLFCGRDVAAGFRLCQYEGRTLQALQKRWGRVSLPHP